MKMKMKNSKLVEKLRKKEKTHGKIKSVKTKQEKNIMSRKKRKNNDEEKRKEKHLREEENNYNYKYKYIYMSDVVEINELQNIQDPIICSYCEKNISKYPMNLQDVAFKLLCGSNCYYHLKCFTDLCNESDFDSFNCINCGAGLVRSDCQYASALLDLAVSTHTVDYITADVSDLLKIFNENEELVTYLTNPLYSKSAKKKGVRGFNYFSIP